MAICVASGNKVMDTRDWHSQQGVPPKYDVSGWRWGRLFNAFCMFFKYPSPADKSATSPSGGEVWHSTCCQKILGTRPRMTGARSEVRNNIIHKVLDVVRQYAALLERGVQSSTLAKKLPADAVQCGRSMIEMLGVLAIIGVLSVGGIAGYSKAMEMYKVNKIIQDYNALIFGLLEYRQNFQKNITNEIDLTDTVIALNLVPNTWTQLNYKYLQDTYGNWVNVRYRALSKHGTEAESEGIIIDFNLGGLSTDGVSTNFNEKICFEMFKNIIQPLHGTMNVGYLSASGHQRYYFGDKFCTEETDCLNKMTLSDMKESCGGCDGKGRCNVTILF